jgi:hypothetical protein
MEGGEEEEEEERRGRGGKGKGEEDHSYLRTLKKSTVGRPSFSCRRLLHM